MSNGMYTLPFTVHRDNRTVTPDTVVEAGVCGDHLAAVLQFDVGESDRLYRLEIVDGGGAFDRSELLTAENGVVTYAVPAAWTTPGTATLRLWEGGENKEDPLFYYAPIRLFFADREEGLPAEHTPVWQQITADAETTLEQLQTTAAELQETAEKLDNAERMAQQAADTAETAWEQADTALQKAKTAEHLAETVRGVYVGGGEMPEGYTVQIDPDGAALTMDSALSADSANPVENRAVTAAITALQTRMDTFAGSSSCTAIATEKRKITDFAGYASVYAAYAALMVHIRGYASGSLTFATTVMLPKLGNEFKGSAVIVVNDTQPVQINITCSGDTWTINEHDYMTYGTFSLYGL